MTAASAPGYASALLGQSAVWFIAAAGLTLAWRNDWVGLYLLAAGVLLLFVTAGVNARVPLIEINRQPMTPASCRARRASPRWRRRTPRHRDG